MQFDLFDEGQNEILGAKTYAEFKEALSKSGCARCALSESRTHIVVDRGNPEAKVLIVGEAPGETEDREGKAFVGRAGRLLDELMKEASFDTDRESLIVNVVKCRPPENRAPQPKEAASCAPFLKRQLELVRPRIILLLGATALKHLIPDKGDFSMQEEAGRFFEHADYPGVTLMVLYHPAFILRDPRKRPVMMEHIRRFKDYWDKMACVSPSSKGL
ncbi:MAG: uracil-DNA glycosylase [Candidatus Omnitrophica bacterium]|nr:uracil-DNA glycosylase [Candidatus Omnitrophota bacterium]